MLNMLPHPPGKPLKELERQYGVTDSIKMASHENSLGPSAKAVAVIAANLQNLHRYPDGSSRAPGVSQAPLPLSGGAFYFPMLHDLEQVSERSFDSEMTHFWTGTKGAQMSLCSSLLTATASSSRVYGFLIKPPAPSRAAFFTSSLSEKPLAITAFWPGWRLRISS